MNQIPKVEPGSELRRIPLEAITVDPSVQQRVAGTSQEVVDDYARAMRVGDPFPPIIVFSDDGVTYHLADGFHRIAALRLAHPDVTEIHCEVHLGIRDDALLYAVGANGSHGLQRSYADKRQAVLSLLRNKTWSRWSNRQIAWRCKVSHTLVAKVRGEHLELLPDDERKDDVLEACASPAPTLVPAVADDGRRIAVRGGKPYPMNTALIGARRATPSRQKNAGSRPTLNSLVWSTATNPERVKFVTAVGGREILEAFKLIAPGFDLQDWAFKTASHTERQSFAKRHHGEISAKCTHRSEIGEPRESSIFGNGPGARRIGTCSLQRNGTVASAGSGRRMSCALSSTGASSPNGMSLGEGPPLFWAGAGWRTERRRGAPYLESDPDGGNARMHPKKWGSNGQLARSLRSLYVLIAPLPNRLS
jgi:hypothetical protein